MTVPDTFRAAASQFANELRASFASRQKAQPEDQLKGPVQALLQATRQQVRTKTEVHVEELGGRPDIGVEVGELLCGHVELKAPGVGAVTRRFKGHDKAQWQKFTALPNLLYTDACEWALYRSGIAQPEARPVVVRLDDIIERGEAALTETLLAQLHELLQDFLTWDFVAPSGPKALAETLAPICRLLRDDVAAAVAHDGSALKRLSAEMRDYLFPHTSDEDFADIYAQTLTYALLLARLNGKTQLTTNSAADALDSGHGLLAETLRVLTQTRARAEIDVPVSILERVIGAVDPARLGRRGDPWLYFYEDFLAAYDPKRRKEYGVYYTPQPVVACQTALVAELLDREFNKPMAYADEGVVLLDSSAGTAAYPLAAIEFALRKVEAALGPGAVAEYATRCARNVYAFEVQVGPYAVSHLRLTKLLADAGATLPSDGLHVLLTDTLESPHVEPPQPPLMAERLTEEQRRARRVKADVPVFVSMGNPPYFREQAEAGQDNTRGKWVRFGDSSTSATARRAAGTARPILDDFVDLAPAVHVKNLYNLYVYFWRWTLWKMFEQPGAPRRGIVSFITASSYLRGPGFAGMRQRMREAFDELWIIDLEGSSLGARKTENVFAIQTPVCIAIGARYAETKRHELARVRYAKFEGTREAKLERLAASTSFSALAWQDCFDEGTAPLLPMQAGDYFAWPQLTDIWPWQHSGVELKRTWPIGETPAVLAQRWRELVAAPKEQRAQAFRETPDRLVAASYKALNEEVRLKPIADLPADTPAPTIVRYGFRSLDRSWLILDNRLASRLRPVLWAVQGEHQIFMTSMLTGVLGVGPAATATAFVPDRHHFRGSFSGKDVIPLWRDVAAKAPNLPATLLACLGERLGVEVSAPDLFAYTYGLLSATSYTEMYSDELTLPPLRLPISADAALFAEVAAAGRQLLWRHTYGERFVPAGQLRGRLPPGRAKSVVGIADAGLPESFEWVPDSADAGSGALHIDAGRMAPVSRAVWEFGVSGYPVLASWLSSRMRRRSGKKSSSLDELRPQSWDATMSQELRELIWVLEATVDAQPRLNALLLQVVAGPVVAADELPLPTDLERLPPGEEDEVPAQQQLI